MLSTTVTALARFRYYRFIGRFHGLRRLSAAGRRLADRCRGGPVVDTGRDRAAATWAEAVRQRGFSPGPRLDPAAIVAIRRYAERQPCRRTGGGDGFRISEVREGLAPDGAEVAVADVDDPEGCPEISEIVGDAELLETASRFLRYRPRRTRTRLYWSPVTSATDSLRRRAGQAIDFHYDIDACNSFYLYFYLIGGGPTSGAHVVVQKSHGPKPMRMVAGSCFQSEESVTALYGEDNVTVVAGGPGYGFFEDPACFHKALAPTRAPRLCLQLRYS